ncbi:hypothetical protein ACFLTA_07705 [Bacteroidota bacterium]
MSLRRFLPFLLIPAIIVGALSCNEQWLNPQYDTTIQWQGGYEGPVVYGNLGLKDLLEKFDSTGYVSEDTTGLLYAAYSKDTVMKAPSILRIPDQDFLQFFFRVDSIVPGWALGPIGSVYTQNQQKGFKYERFGDERLDSIHVKGGSMNIYVRSTIKHMGTLTLSSNDVMVGGKPYHEVVSISNANGDFEQTTSLDLAGSTIIFDNSVPDSSSLIINADFDLINSGADILPTEEVQIINSFRDLEFRGAYGYIGDYDSVIIDKAELEFELLQGNFEGRIKLANPQLSIRSVNTMGVPFDIELRDLEAHFSDGSGTAITIDPTANPLRIDAPTIAQVGQSVMDSTFIDNTNSTIHEAATSDLVSFQYSVRVIANPDGPRDNFILDDSELAISVEGLIPLDLRMEDVVLSDTFDFSFSEDEDSDFTSDDVKKLGIRMETDNSMPLDLGIQIYFVDTTTWVRLDSLFGADRDVFKSGVIDADGRVIQPTNKVTEVELSKDQIDNALNSHKMLMKAFVETTDGGTKDVKFYSNYSLDFKLGASIELDVNIEPNEGQ